jgi:hypothetical protein
MKTMAIHAEAVDILVRKSRFEPEVAIGIAEAIEVSINLSNLVTVPVLDSRLNEIKLEMQKLHSDLVRWVFLAMLGNVALSTSAGAVLKLFSH